MVFRRFFFARYFKASSFLKRGYAELHLELSHDLARAELPRQSGNSRLTKLTTRLLVRSLSLSTVLFLPSSSFHFLAILVSFYRAMRRGAPSIPVSGFREHA